MLLVAPVRFIFISVLRIIKKFSKLIPYLTKFLHEIPWYMLNSYTEYCADRVKQKSPSRSSCQDFTRTDKNLHFAGPKRHMSTLLSLTLSSKSKAKEKYRGVFEIQKSGDKTSSGEIGLFISNKENVERLVRASV